MTDMPERIYVCRNTDEDCQAEYAGVSTKGFLTTGIEYTRSDLCVQQQNEFPRELELFLIRWDAHKMEKVSKCVFENYIQRFRTFLEYRKETENV